MFLDEQGNPVVRGASWFAASGVPGSVAGLAFAQRKYGRLPLAAVMRPAIELARDGFEISWSFAASLAAHRSLFAQFPATARAFLREDGTPPEAGERLRQADLATTLQAIAEQGPDAFYRGRIAQLIAAEMSRTSGLITIADLARYEPNRKAASSAPTAVTASCRWRPRVLGAWRCCSCQHPRGYPLAQSGHDSSVRDLMIEAERRVYADVRMARRSCVRPRSGGWPHRKAVRGPPPRGRRREAGDSEQRHQTRTAPRLRVVPDDPLLRRRRRGQRRQHDHQMNGGYGSGQVVTGAGFLSEQRDGRFQREARSAEVFRLLPAATPDAIAPGKRMLSSMTATIVVRDGHTWLVAGSPGGGQIVTTVLQVLVNAIDHHIERAGGRRWGAISRPITLRQGAARGGGGECNRCPRGARRYDARRQRRHAAVLQGGRHRARNGPPARRDRGRTKTAAQWDLEGTKRAKGQGWGKTGAKTKG